MANVTFENSEIIDVQAWYLKHIIHVASSNTTSATFDGFLSDGCNSSEALVSYDGGSITMLHSQFSKLSNTAVYSTGVVSAFLSSTFQGQANTSQVQNPGVVISNVGSVSSSAIFNGCNFSSYFSNTEGGAVYAEVASISVNGSRFSNNTGMQGGAINAYASSGTITASIFEGNAASDEDGGAVRLLPPKALVTTSNFTVNGSSFVGNSASNSAAGVCAFGVSLLDVSGCSFHSNAGNGSSQGPWQGSAIGVDTPHAVTAVFLRDSVFTDSLAGASVFLRNCLCVGAINNVFANSSHVGLVVLGTVGDTCETDYAFEAVLFHPKNVSAVAEEQHGIDDYFTGAQLTNDIRFCSFTNHALSQQPSINHYLGGAGLYIQGGLISHNLISGSYFDSNSGVQGSGAYIESSSATVIWNTSFVNNLASKSGGGISSVLNGADGIMVGDCLFYNNSAELGGGIFGDINTQMVLTAATQFVANQALYDGGGVYCSECSKVETRPISGGINFTQNYAGRA